MNGLTRWLAKGIIPLLGLALLALTGCGGGGGSTPVLQDTTLTGTVLNLSGSTLLGRGATATTASYSNHVAVATGVLQLVRVNNDGSVASVLKDNITLGADGSFSVSVSPSVAVVGQNTLVLSHSGGLKTVVSAASGLRVDPVATYLFEKAAESGFSALNLTTLQTADAALRAAWQQSPVQVSSADGDNGNLTRLLGALGGLAAQSSVSLGSQSGFCTGGVQAFLVSSDYRAGALAAACLSGGQLSVRKNLASIHQDAVVSYANGNLYVLNRYRGDNLQVINPNTYATTNQLSLKATPDELPNPQDIEVISATKAFVSLYDKAQLLVIDPTKTTLATATLATLDLTGFNAPADGDNRPEATFLVRHQNRLYVGLQRINQADFSYDPVSGSALAVVDVESNQLVDQNATLAGTQGIELPGKNCSAAGLDAANGKLYVACTGDFFNPDFSAAPNLATDGLIAVDLATGAATVIASNSALGLKVSGFVFGSASRSYVALYDASTYQTTLKPIDLGAGAAGATLLSGDLSGLTVDSAGNLWAGVRTSGASGLRLFNSAGTAINTSATSIGLPPSAIVIAQ